MTIATNTSTFVTAKLNRATMAAAGTALNVRFPTGVSPLGMATLLSEHFERSVSKNDLVTCDVCNGDSDPGLDLCPYCGIEEADVAIATTAPSAASAPTNGATPAVNTETKEEAVMQTETIANGKSTNGKAKGEAKKAAKKGAAKPAKVGQQELPATEALVTRSAAGTLAAAPELDRAVTRVKELKGAAAVGYWALGAYIKVEIFEKQLWKQRTDAAGKVAYKTGGFEAFVRTELGMTVQNAYKLMDVAAHFDEEQVRKFGTSKLALVLRAPKEDQDRILAGIESGALKGVNAGTLKGEVNKARAAKGETRRETGRKPTPAGKKPKMKITIASLEGRKKIELFVKPEKRSDDPKRAKRIGDHPVGTLELENGVIQHFTLQANAAGELELIIVTKRVEA